MNFTVDGLLKLDPFDYIIAEKDKLFSNALQEMAIYHYENCDKYKRFCDNNAFNPNNDNNLTDYPYIPVNIFKNTELISVPKNKLIRRLQSSATTSGIPSKVHIDAETSKRQILASSSVMRSFLHSIRHTFFILDSNPYTNVTLDLTARIAATRGFLIMAREYEYFMENKGDGKVSLQVEKFIEACNNHAEKQQKSHSNLTIFGFTFIVYEYVVKALMKKNISVNLSGAKLAHIGGWKKLFDRKVVPAKFKEDVYKTLGILPEDIVDFYGFTEQMGIIYGENKYGYKVTPAYSEIIIRDTNSLEVVPDGEVGFIQTISPIFSSYPGISVLTEDMGKIVGRNDSECGRLGTCFEIIGRAKEAEIRGCGDLMEEKMVM